MAKVILMDGVNIRFGKRSFGGLDLFYVEPSRPTNLFDGVEHYQTSQPYHGLGLGP